MRDRNECLSLHRFSYGNGFRTKPGGRRRFFLAVLAASTTSITASCDNRANEFEGRIIYIATTSSDGVVLNPIGLICIEGPQPRDLIVTPDNNTPEEFLEVVSDVRRHNKRQASSIKKYQCKVVEG